MAGAGELDPFEDLLLGQVAFDRPPAGVCDPDANDLDRLAAGLNVGRNQLGLRRVAVTTETATLTNAIVAAFSAAKDGLE
jgi:hypothetical protein